jgi:site-specific DNA-cytosine methylase
MTMRAIEFFCGIGGFSAAAAGCNVQVAAAFDQSAAAIAVHRLNFPGCGARQVDLVRITAAQIEECRADLWWLSPPCQPYCIRGNRRLLDILFQLPDKQLPRFLALENVEGFLRSEARARLIELMSMCGYRFHEALLCPTDLGIPTRRRRYYLAASRGELRPVHPSVQPIRPLSEYLDP